MGLLNSLSPKRGSTHKKKRVGRGDGSNWGGTAGKGHKGQKARAGGRIRRGFEGGQTPLIRRLPKFGFKNTDFKNEYSYLNIGQFGELKEITPQILVERGLISKNDKLKILAKGKLEGAVKVKAHKFSAKAKELIEKAGGTTEVI
jgi:large subunit ribosomal protein L15